MNDPVTYVIEVIQHMINAFKRKNDFCVVDGVYGPQSASAYAGLNSDQRAVIDDFAVAVGLSLPKLVTGEDILNAMSSLSPRFQSYVTLLVKTEVGINVNKPTDFFILDPQAKYRGIGQFDEPTWNAVMPHVSFSKACDVNQSLTAVVQLYKQNQAAFNRMFLGKPYTNEVAYLFHNQGAPSALKLLKSLDMSKLTYPDQSPQAREIIARAVSQIKEAINA